VQGWNLERMHMPVSCFRCCPFVVDIAAGWLLIAVIFCLDDNSPTSRKDAAMGIQLIRLEEEPPEDRVHCHVVPIWQMHKIANHYFSLFS
jgi:hypothetical protein